MPEMERSELHANQSRHFQAKTLHQPFHLAVLALRQFYARPGVHALAAFEIGDDGSVLDAVNRDAGGKPVEIGLRYLAEQSGTICALPAACRQFEAARQIAIVRQKKQGFLIEIEATDRDHTWQMFGQVDEDGGPAFGILVR